MEVIQLLVVETNKYYNQYSDTLDNDKACSWLPDVTVWEMNTFLPWYQGHSEISVPSLEQFYTPFYSNTMKHGRFLHILRFLYFNDNMNQPHKNNCN
jgi:hypothetical protein